jgi:hypothetical protein
MIIRKLIAATLIFIGLSACDSNYLEERHEHGNVTCVYRVHDNFWGTDMDEKLIACQPPITN